MKAHAQELEDRLIDFAARIIEVVEVLPGTKAGNHIANQLIRSGTAPAPNYGEAQSAESRNDFIHKLKVALKELRETSVWLRIVARRGMISEQAIKPALQECHELISIFVSSAKTADANSSPGRSRSSSPKK